MAECTTSATSTSEFPVFIGNAYHFHLKSDCIPFAGLTEMGKIMITLALPLQQWRSDTHTRCSMSFAYSGYETTFPVPQLHVRNPPPYTAYDLAAG